MAERIAAGELPASTEWEPVHLGVSGPEPDRSAVERQAADQGLQEFRWPEHWPMDTRSAMLAATYAKRIGRVVAFSLAAFRQAFAGGHDLGDQDTLLIVGAACEIHPTALLKALETRAVSEALEQATSRARAAGVEALPAVA
jgi:2-hydroxychromene-2-carboxylate isomerase